MKTSCGLLICLCLAFTAEGQSMLLKGIIKDAHSEERIPFASIQLKKNRQGKLSDSAGNYALRLEGVGSDSLIVTYVGFRDYILIIDSNLYNKQSNGII